MRPSNEIEDVIKEISEAEPDKTVLSNARKGDTVNYRKIVLTKILIKDTTCYQIEKYTEKQVFFENVQIGEWQKEVLKYASDYKQLNIYSAKDSYEIKFNKNRDFIINKSQIKTDDIVHIKPKLNNRQKNYLFKEGMELPIFVEIGIFTKEYKVVNSMYDKFKQINRFTEMVDDVLRNFEGEIINIIDFGCGKSYLTFAIYCYLTKIRKIRANIIGLDLKADVIEKCNSLADKYDMEGLHFEVGDINGYKAPFKVDMVVTLHACDTATDYALFNAINWEAKYIMSVPCCQHEVNKQIQSECMSGLLKYGIIKERTAALVTDAIRGCMLENCGYSTDLMEFIDIEHSPKNILIRARKTNISPERRKAAYNQALQLCEEFKISQKLVELLK